MNPLPRVLAQDEAVHSRAGVVAAQARCVVVLPGVAGGPCLPGPDVAPLQVEQGQPPEDVLVALEVEGFGGAEDVLVVSGVAAFGFGAGVAGEAAAGERAVLGKLEK